MVIIPISWRIKPGMVGDFKSWWMQHAEVDDPSSLFGELLSEHRPAAELPFKSDDLQLDDGRYVPFINVGVWKTWQIFFDQVGKYFRDDGSCEPFEIEPRPRTILTPRESRVGAWTEVGVG